MKFWRYTFIVLSLIIFLLILSVFETPDNNLHLIACSVGEGDATLLIYKNIQILIDGGPDKKVLDCLGRHLPFYDRTIEMIILTHPDRDHFMGLIDVFRNYKVDNYMYNLIAISKPEYGVLEKEVGRGGVTPYSPLTTRKLRLSLIYLDIFAPFEQLSVGNYQFSNEQEVPDTETNNYSIVSLISFKKFRALFTGDMPSAFSNRLFAERAVKWVNYIKIPHHGSKYGLTQNLLEILRPGVATISVGKNNYGHPAHEILDMLKKYGVRVFRTDEKGDVEVISDGETFWVDN